MATYTVQDLRAMILRGEGQYLEFKSLWDRKHEPPKVLDRRTVRDTIAEYVAAFANADGGDILLGVDDDGSLSGHEYPDDAIDNFLSVPSARLRPPVRTESSRHTLDGKSVIIISVPRAPEAVMVNADGFPYRIGDTVVKLPQEEINALKQAQRLTGFDQRVAADAALDDLDLDLAISFLAKGPTSSKTIMEQLSYYGLLIPKGAGLAITYGALLLFGKRPMNRWHPKGDIRLFRVQGRERTTGARRNVAEIGRFQLPIARLIPDAYAGISAHIRKSEKLHDLFFREMPEYPTMAWQEALVNAVSHRDYSDMHREIEITLFDDRMETESPGDLVPPVTIEDLRDLRRVHASRNPLIARVLVDAGIMREQGEGVPRMYDEMRASLLKPPAFESTHQALIVSFSNSPVYEGADVSWKLVLDTHHIADSIKRALLLYPMGFTNEEYRAANEVDRDRAYKDIIQAMELGILRNEGSSGRGARWSPSSNLRSEREWLSPRLDWLGILFSRKALFSSSDYGELRGGSPTTVRRDLDRLEEYRLVKKQGEKKGRVYLPGCVWEGAVEKGQNGG